MKKILGLVVLLLSNIAHASEGEWLISATPEWVMEHRPQGMDHGFGAALSTSYTLTPHFFMGLSFRFLGMGSQEETRNSMPHGGSFRRFDVLPSIGWVWGHRLKWRMGTGLGLRTEQEYNRWDLFIDAIAPTKSDTAWRALGVAETFTSLSYRIPRNTGGTVEIGIQGTFRHRLGQWQWRPETALAFTVGWWWMG